MTDKALEAALLPCPFCGGTPILSKSGGSSEVDGYTTFHVVSCKSCHVKKHAHSKPYTGPSEEVAIGSVTAAWNRRAPLSALPGEAEVVAWIRSDDLQEPPERRHVTAWEKVATSWAEGFHPCTPLVTLASLQAMQARAEKAERERDDLRASHNENAKLRGQRDASLALVEAAEARVKELEAENARLRRLDAEYGRVETAIIMADPDFDGDSPHDNCGDRLIASVHRLRDLAARTALTGGSNG